MFARHETFHPRYGWFRKAVAAASEHPGAFLEDDATVRLGVGKNMVRSIRFWGASAQLLAQVPNPHQPRRPFSVPSRVGEALLGPDGLDPYLERPETIWLIHWLMLAPGGQLPVWWIALNEFSAIEFTQRELEDTVREVLEESEWPAPRPSAIEKDVSCLLRAYAPTGSPRGRGLFDDRFDSPLRELGLLREPDPGSGRYRWVLGDKPGLPPDLISAIVFDYLARADREARTISLHHLLTVSGGPGRTLKLTEQQLRNGLNASAAADRGFTVTNIVGGAQLAFEGAPTEIAGRLVERLYGGVPRHAIMGVGRDLPADDSYWNSEQMLVVECGASKT